jgi:hypothetical protein
MVGEPNPMVSRLGIVIVAAKEERTMMEGRWELNLRSTRVTTSPSATRGVHGYGSTREPTNPTQPNPLFTRTRSYTGRTRPNPLYTHIIGLGIGSDFYNPWTRLPNPYTCVYERFQFSSYYSYWLAQFDGPISQPFPYSYFHNQFPTNHSIKHQNFSQWFFLL